MLDVNDIMRPVKPFLRAAKLAEAQLGRAIPQLPFRPRRLIWHRGGRPWADVELTLQIHTGCGLVRLRYDVDHRARRTGPQEHVVQIVSTPCRFGGV